MANASAQLRIDAARLMKSVPHMPEFLKIRRFQAFDVFTSHAAEASRLRHGNIFVFFFERLRLQEELVRFCVGLPDQILVDAMVFDGDKADVPKALSDFLNDSVLGEVSLCKSTEVNDRNVLSIHNYQRK